MNNAFKEMNEKSLYLTWKQKTFTTTDAVFYGKLRSTCENQIKINIISFYA